MHEELLLCLRDGWHDALEDELLALYVHGSLIAGDFAPERSDLDVLAVLRTEPDEALLRVLAVLHENLDARYPAWAGRVEVEYAAIATINAPEGGVIARISPGEALHLLPVTTHRAVTWATVRATGRPLLGPPPGELLPSFDADLVREALLDHVRDWPAWVTEMTAPGAQSYAVLTMCRAVQRLSHGEQLSKRQAADRTLAGSLTWAELIAWARDWWFSGGEDTDPGRFEEVQAFVTATSAALLQAEAARAQTRRSASAVAASAGRNASMANSDSVTSSGVPSTDVTLKNDNPPIRSGTTNPAGFSAERSPG
jgi:hypothetical protein